MSILLLNIEPIQQKSAWMTSQIYTLEIKRLAKYCQKHYPNEVFDLGQNRILQLEIIWEVLIPFLSDVLEFDPVSWKGKICRSGPECRRPRPSPFFGSLFDFNKVIDNAPVHKLLIDDENKPKNLRIIFLRPNCTGHIQVKLNFNLNVSYNMVHILWCHIIWSIFF